MSTDLIVRESIDPVKVFTGGGLDDLLAKIKNQVVDFVPDLQTRKGRKEIASLARKVSSSKTLLDGLGKDLVSDWKTKAKAVDGERKRAREYLDSLKEEVRLPLTEWEAAEEKRVDEAQKLISSILCLRLDLDESDSATIKARLDDLELIVVDESLEEFQEEAQLAKDDMLKDITAKLAQARKREEEQAELARLRKEAAEREEADRRAEAKRAAEEHDKEIRAEAAEQATREAEEATQLKIALAEREAAEANERHEKELRESMEREERAKKDAELAALRERERIENERKAEEEKTRRREANKKHRAKVEREVTAGIVATGVHESEAIGIIGAIKAGGIPHVTISY